MKNQYAKRKDTNHDKISRAFQVYGWTVIDTSAFSGKMLDLIVYRGNMAWKYFYFVEVKNNEKFTLTKAEKDFMYRHQGAAITIWNVEQVEALTKSCQ
jgi:hypothetical protein